MRYSVETCVGQGQWKERLHTDDLNSARKFFDGLRLKPGRGKQLLADRVWIKRIHITGDGPLVEVNPAAHELGGEG